jgi:hypothetical protein
MSNNNSSIFTLFDCAVILTKSNLPIDNHIESFYINLSKYLTIIIVKPDLIERKFYYEKTSCSNVTVLHIYRIYGRLQSHLIREALVSLYLIKPIFCIDNFLFIDFVVNSYSISKIFFSTEEHLINNEQNSKSWHKRILITLLDRIDLLIPSDNKVRDGCLSNIFYSQWKLSSTNVCDYSLKPDMLEGLEYEIANIVQKQKISTKHIHSNVLILYDYESIHVNTIKEHLESFIQFSFHNINYVSATGFAEAIESFNDYDVIVIHYSIRVNITNYLSPAYTKALKHFGGYKVLYIQDEYDTTEIARKWIRETGIHTVFTCVPDRYINHIYSKERFPAVEFVQTLTGFVPQRFENQRYLQSFIVKPPSERKLSIVYRGRKLPYWYGDLGQEKFEIGIKFKKICQERELLADIECDDSKRIYGDNWYYFLASGKATLGTESGSNIFDDFGDIRLSIEAEIKKHPQMTYEEVRDMFLSQHVNKIKMNQVSPKMFEAIALKTALILFEGDYSGILKPELHYISLKKDFSHIDEVLSKLQDNQYLEELVNQAYDDIVASGKYSYQKFINEFDKFLSGRVSIRKKYPNFILEECLASLEEQQKIDSLKLLFISAIKNPSFWTDLLISNIQIVKLNLQSLWFRLKKIIKKLLRKVR